MKKILFILNLFLSQLNNTHEIIIHYPYENVTFNIYHVADIIDNEMIFTDDFKDISKDLNWDEFEKNAFTLANLVAYHKIHPLETLNTKSNFPIKFLISLSSYPKVYLLVGENHSIHGKTYEIAPTLLYVSLDTPVDNIYPKNTLLVTHTTINIMKIWNDSINQSKESIEIELIKDNKYDRTIILNEENNWRVQLDVEPSNYQVIEKNIPKGYTVTYEKQDNHYIIINTKNNEDNKTLPNTGIPLIHIYLLFICGITLIIIGQIRK